MKHGGSIGLFVLGAVLLFCAGKLAYSGYTNHGGGMVAIYEGQVGEMEPAGNRFADEQSYRKNQFVGASILGLLGLCFCSSALPDGWWNRLNWRQSDGG